MLDLRLKVSEQADSEHTQKPFCEPERSKQCMHKVAGSLSTSKPLVQETRDEHQETRDRPQRPAKVKQELPELTQQLKSVTQRVAAVKRTVCYTGPAPDRYEHAVREGV